MKNVITVGAVAYHAKAVPIWEGIRDYFLSENVELDYILFSNYERQVEALFDGTIDIAWNTNLAYVRADRLLGGRSQILAMRDTDVKFTTKILVAAKGNIKTIADLEGKKVAFGSRDSAQAAVVPEYYLMQSKLNADRNYTAIRFNTDVGKHGDTGRSENEVIEAIRNGTADAGCVGESTFQNLLEKGEAGDLRAIWTSPAYSHCNFTALPNLSPAKAKLFVDTLLRMDYNNPLHRPVLDMEGLKRWVPGERAGYDSVFAAVDAVGYLMAKTSAAVASK